MPIPDSGWIKSSERLPPVGSRVIGVWRDRPALRKNRRWRIAVVMRLQDEWINADGRVPVEEWKPLPAHPKIKV